MEYSRAIGAMEAMGRFAERPGVENAARMLALLGIDSGAPVIHIAGTNGKGSTAVYTAELLARAGYRVGLFTSPHLVSYTERIRIVTAGGEEKAEGIVRSTRAGGEHPGDVTGWEPKAEGIVRSTRAGGEISEEEFGRLAEKVLAISATVKPSLFDILFVMAMLYFEESACDCIVLETGLGGRLDSTRAVPQTPVVSCITSIGLDHVGILGDSIEDIAAEKAGILRPGTKAVLGEMEETAACVITDCCRKLGVPITRVHPEEMAMAASAGYQARNLAAAAAICGAFGVEVGREELAALAAKVTIPGRMHVIRRHPTVMVDVAHNEEAVRTLFASLAERFPGERWIGAVSMLREREAAQVFGPAVPFLDSVYVFRVGDERGQSGEKIAEYFRGQGVETHVCGVLKDSGRRGGSTGPEQNSHGEAPRGEEGISEFEQIVELAGSRGRRVIAFGSFYFTGELLWMENR